MDFSSPQSTFKSYLQACKEQDFSKSDLHYTNEFRKFIKTNQGYLSHRNVGQLQNEYNSYFNKSYVIEVYDDRVIFRFAHYGQPPPPIYFVKEDGLWKIDAMFSFNNVIMSSGGHWHWKNPNIDNEKIWIDKQY